MHVSKPKISDISWEQYLGYTQSPTTEPTTDQTTPSISPSESPSSNPTITLACNCTTLFEQDSLTPTTIDLHDEMQYSFDIQIGDFVGNPDAPFWIGYV